MNHFCFRLFILLTCLYSGFSAAADEYRYVSDKLFVPLRTGMGSSFKIIHRGLSSGTRLNLISEDLDAGWSLVRTDKGQEGWVQNQYIVDEPIARIKLVQAEERNAAITEQLTTVSDNLKNLRAEHSALQAQLNDTASGAEKLDTELRTIKEISANALQLNEQHQTLIKDHQILQTERDLLTAENEKLKTDRTFTQWMYGAGILLLGVIATLILQSTGRRKHYSEWA